MEKQQMNKKELLNKRIYYFFKENLRLFLIPIIIGVFVTYFISTQPNLYRASILIKLCKVGNNLCIDSIEKIYSNSFYSDESIKQCGINKDNDESILTALTISPQKEEETLKINTRPMEKNMADNCLKQITKDLSRDDFKTSNYLITQKDKYIKLESKIKGLMLNRNLDATISYFLNIQYYTQQLIDTTNPTLVIMPISFSLSDNLILLKKYPLFIGALLGIIFGSFLTFLKYFVRTETESNSK
jgi:hypothetical protein